jgi:hypothetical protein
VEFNLSRDEFIESLLGTLDVVIRKFVDVVNDLERFAVQVSWGDHGRTWRGLRRLVRHPEPSWAIGRIRVVQRRTTTWLWLVLTHKRVDRRG